MEEEPTAIAPDLEKEKEFIIKSEKTEVPDIPGKPEIPEEPTADEFDLSDITHNTPELSREEIIAAAEAAAYNE